MGQAGARVTKNGRHGFSSVASYTAKDAQAAIGYATSARAAANDARSQADIAAVEAQNATNHAQTALTGAQTAQAAAEGAVRDAATAGEAAAQATESAATASEQAGIAIESASVATNSLSDVERVVGTLNWIAEHGRYVAETSSTLVDGRVYYTRSGSGTTADPYVYTVVGEPDVSEISSYYYLVVDESVQNYINSHVWIDTDGLNVAYENNETGTKTVRTGWRIGSVFELLRDSVSWFKLWIENNVAKMRLGRVTSGHVVLDDSGFEVFDNDNNTVVSVAKFGLDGAQVGRSGESHIELDYHSMQLIDKEGDVYFYVSDLRDASGVAVVTEHFRGTGTKRIFNVLFEIYAVVSVKVDNVPVSYTGPSSSPYTSVTLTNAPGACQDVLIVYKTQSSGVKAFTYGTRLADSTIGAFSYSEGMGNTASNYVAHAEGHMVTASGYASHAEGRATTASDFYSHAEGYSTTASNEGAHAEGYITTASGTYSHAEGFNATASNADSHAEGTGTTASGVSSHAEGSNTIASGDQSHAEGGGVTASGKLSHAEGYGTTASGQYSHAEGEHTTASGKYSHAEGGAQTTASSEYSHAEGEQTIASGWSGHAEGSYARASGYYSHAEGKSSRAEGECSHAQNKGTRASSDNQTALGKYNVEDANGTYAAIVGNGTADDARSDAARLKWTGDLQLAGDVQDMSGNGLYAPAGHTHPYLPLAGGNMTGAISSQPGTGVSYIKGTAGEHAGLFVRKSTLNQNAWIPAVTVQTKTGGGWAIGNYDDETLEFVYGSKANIDADNNSTVQIYFTASGGAVFPSSINAGQVITFGDGTVATLSAKTPGRTASILRVGGAAKSAGDVNGTVVRLSGGGLTLVGGGEYADNRYNLADIGDGTEDLYLGADGTVYIETNGQTIGSRKTFTFNTNGNLAVPGSITSGGTAVSLAGHGNHVPATQTADNATYLRNDNTWHKITPANIGAAATTHGNHVPTLQTASNKVFLRNDNTWQTVTPANIGALPTAGGTMSGTFKFASATALPNASTSTDFFVTGINAFANGGQLKYKGLADVKTWLGLDSLAYKSSVALGRSIWSEVSTSISLDANSLNSITTPYTVPSGKVLMGCYGSITNNSKFFMTGFDHDSTYVYNFGTKGNCTVTKRFVAINSSLS